MFVCLATCGRAHLQLQNDLPLMVQGVMSNDRNMQFDMTVKFRKLLSKGAHDDVRFRATVAAHTALTRGRPFARNLRDSARQSASRRSPK